VTALLVTRHDQDWMGFAIVMGLFALSLAAWAHYFYVEGGQTRLTLDRVIRGLAQRRPEPDHTVCSNIDCGAEICCCHGPGECTGCDTLGCPHGEGLCWTCRLGCRECMAEQDFEWAARR
jgi:hypothetical protein